MFVREIINKINSPAQMMIGSPDTVLRVVQSVTELVVVI